MKLPIFLLLLAVTIFLFNCQPSQKLTLVKIEHPYQFPNEIATKLAQDSTPWKFEPAAWAYSEIGDFDNTLIQWDSSREMLAQNFGVFLNQDSIEVATFKKQYQAQSAKSVILERAANHRVLMINEGHHLPNHRIFTKSLLKDLWDLGYRHLGLEAIRDDLAQMHQLGYPTYEVGNYTKEPQFGELIRTALSLGFTVFGYDSDDLYDEAREIDQAEGILEVLQKYPNDKVLIHCGFGHLNESSNNRLMGFHLAQKAQLDPLTINQYFYSERHSAKYEHQVFTDLVSDVSIVFVDKNGKDFRKPTPDSMSFDLLVFHPRTTYKNGRPAWMEDEEKQLTKVDLPTLPHDCPCLVMAIPAEESVENSVPIDVVTINQSTKNVFLALAPKAYKIVVQNQKKEGIYFSFERK